MWWLGSHKPRTREEARDRLHQVELRYPGDGRVPNLRVAQAIEGQISIWSSDYLWGVRLRRAYRCYEAFLSPSEKRAHEDRRRQLLNPELQANLAV